MIKKFQFITDSHKDNNSLTELNEELKNHNIDSHKIISIQTETCDYNEYSYGGGYKKIITYTIFYYD